MTAESPAAEGDAAFLVMPRPGDEADRAAEYQAVTLPATFGEAPPMVELWLATGNRVGLPYAWLAEVAYDPSVGVTLAFTTGSAVRITGRHLGPVFAALLAHQAVTIREADPPTAELAKDGAAVVEAIVVEKTAP